MTTAVAPDIDLADLSFWRRPPRERHEAFARLRQLEHPVFFEERRVPLLRSGRGFYALVRHSDVVEASRNAKVFSSEPAVTSPEPPGWVSTSSASRWSTWTTRATPGCAASSRAPSAPRCSPTSRATSRRPPPASWTT
ncbi:hypothetical protein [Thermocatellispora tengchongensis]|uniref:hypothetical protein n=1 Tax=Thermocatellispora tengchongensis TaxID=1073253 RepID=UPI0036403147